MASKTWMQAIQDNFAFSPVGSHGTISVGTAGTTIAVPGGVTGALVQAITQNARFVFAASGAGTATGFRVTAGNDFLYIPLQSVGTVHIVGESDSASVQYQFLGHN